MIPINTSIVLHKLELGVHLGWPEAERLHKQIIFLDIHIDFLEPPHACITDHLDDTYSYEALSDLIEKKIGQRHFRLIEHLGYETYQLLKNVLPHNVLLTICITKKPPIPNLTGGVSFWYGDKK
jgi:dihydroneopterin aldolase